MGALPLIKAAFQPLVPPEMWSSARTRFNRVRYEWLWSRRKTVEFEREGQKIKLTIVDPGDVIQKEQAEGKFYEEEELEDIARYFPKGGVFVDIGSNTGQHSVYVGKLLGASRLIVFEPVEQACKILTENLRLNDLSPIADLSHLGVGVSNRDGQATLSSHLLNLGGSSLQESDKGSVRISSGDSMLAGQKVDFIKIDTEGFEMKVLEGLVQTLAREKPTIFVEVDEENAEAFRAFVDAHDYQIVAAKRRYAANENFIIAPKQ